MDGRVALQAESNASLEHLPSARDIEQRAEIMRYIDGLGCWRFTITEVRKSRIRVSV